MSELNRMGCGQLADVAAELALGALTGRERAEALAHMDHCAACREYIRQLAMIAEELLELLPGIEPSPGFETRVIERTDLTAQDAGPGPGAPSRSRRTLRIVTVAAVTLARRCARTGMSPQSDRSG